MGLVFNKGGDDSHLEKKVANHENHDKGHHVGEPSYIMWLPYGILAVLTVALGVIGPWFSSFLEHTFGSYFESTLHLTTEHVAGGVSPIVHDLLPFISVGMILLGGYPAYQMYIKKKLNPVKIVSSYRGLRVLYKFLWNRWYLDALYNKIFVDGTLKMRSPTIRYVENPMDRLLNEKVPGFFYWLRGPTVRYVEDPMDRLINQRVPGLWVVFSNIGRKFDIIVIDGIANGIAAAGQLMSRVSRTIQRGVLGEYVFAYLVGAILLILYLFYITLLR
jgi:NADH:ubiquinone oxidoreductase subunit 5 (subunit L)/multisubunit Na+/H+ antiporter MnhA subunit